MISDALDPQRPRLTKQQQRIMDAIHDSIRDRGFPPTVREIGAAVGLGSPSTVTYHLKALERLGLLRRQAHAPRAVDVRDAAAPGGGDVTVPLLGSIAAGTPILAEQSIEDELTLPAGLVGHGTLFALTVRGDSMIEAAICDGDVVVVRQQRVADNGDIVAAMIEIGRASCRERV